MALNLWILDKSAHVRLIAGTPLPEGISPARLALCEMSMLEWLYSARSEGDYDAQVNRITQAFQLIEAPPNAFAQALQLQQDLAHHHSMWHRRSIGDLFIATTALAHGAGVVHADSDFELIQQVRPALQLCRL